MQRALELFVENKFGVLARIAGVLSARGYNIEALYVSRTEDPTLSYMTMIVEVDEASFGRLIKLLEKLIDVIEVKEISTAEALAAFKPMRAEASANIVAEQQSS